PGNMTDLGSALCTGEAYESDQQTRRTSVRPTSERPAELDELRETVLRTCRDFGHEYYVRSSVAGDNARELWRALGGVGALGAGISEEYGGAGAGVEALAVVAESIAEAGLPLMLVALSPAVCATMVDEFGTPEQKAEWLPGLADGSKVLGFAITEPDAGSNTHNIRMRARREGASWVLSGQKYYVSHVDNADALLTVARVDDELKVFIVPTDVPGLTKSPIEVVSLSPERQYSVSYDDCRLAESAIVAPVAWMAVLYARLSPVHIIRPARLTSMISYAIDSSAPCACYWLE